VPWVQLIWNAHYHHHRVPHLTSVRGSFWWKDILKLSPQFREIAHCLPAKGDTVSLWEDNLMQTPLANKYPNLYSYAKARHMSLQSCLAPTNCLNIFRLPMSRVAYNEFLSFQEELEFFRSKSDMDDIWIYKWKSPTYRSSKFYQKHFESIVPPMPYKWIWQSKCMPRIKFFTWLLLNDRLNTRDMLRRRHQVLEEGYQCVMHQQNIDETLHLLFFYCSSSQSRWFAVGIQWDMQGDLEQLLIH
jgi:hypothetical protein